MGGAAGAGKKLRSELQSGGGSSNSDWIADEKIGSGISSKGGHRGGGSLYIDVDSSSSGFKLQPAYISTLVVPDRNFIGWFVSPSFSSQS